MIRVAYKVMARDGVHRVPLQQIATEARVSKGLLIYHFQTKDGLVLASLEWVLEATEARIRDHLAESDDPAIAIAKVVEAVWISPEAKPTTEGLCVGGVE